eukprot:m51a1_g1553 hypothetical protein (1366) ;mRNA; r:5781-11319
MDGLVAQGTESVYNFPQSLRRLDLFPYVPVAAVREHRTVCGAAATLVITAVMVVYLSTTIDSFVHSRPVIQQVFGTEAGRRFYIPDIAVSVVEGSDNTPVVSPRHWQIAFTKNVIVGQYRGGKTVRAIEQAGECGNISAKLNLTPSVRGNYSRLLSCPVHSNATFMQGQFNDPEYHYIGIDLRACDNRTYKGPGGCASLAETLELLRGRGVTLYVAQDRAAIQDSSAPALWSFKSELLPHIGVVYYSELYMQHWEDVDRRRYIFDPEKSVQYLRVLDRDSSLREFDPAGATLWRLYIRIAPLRVTQYMSRQLLLDLLGSWGALFGFLVNTVGLASLFISRRMFFAQLQLVSTDPELGLLRNYMFDHYGRISTVGLEEFHRAQLREESAREQFYAEVRASGLNLKRKFNIRRSWRPLSRDNYAPPVVARPLQALESATTSTRIQDILRLCGFESCRLFIGIDYTGSNAEKGHETFDGKSLHYIEPGQCNPYQRVIRALGAALEGFVDGSVAAYGFGDTTTRDVGVFSLAGDSEDTCGCVAEVLERYAEVTPHVELSCPTSFAPLIRRVVAESRGSPRHSILVIVADGQVSDDDATFSCSATTDTIAAIVEASAYPISIVTVGVGDGPWEKMRHFVTKLPQRRFDNFHFVEFHSCWDLAAGDEETKDARLASCCLETETRYAHLLQPLRDLAENWSVDIAKELEEYIDDLEGVTFAFDDSGKSLNFAQAALLIQGSALVYSKKVEYLYNLVFQALEFITSRRRPKEEDPNAANDAAETEPGEEEFLPLDDIAVATNIDLDDNKVKDEDESRDAWSRPGGAYASRALLLAAALRPDTSAGGDAFQLHSCAVHRSGALVLDAASSSCESADAWVSLAPGWGAARMSVAPQPVDGDVATGESAADFSMEIARPDAPPGADGVEPLGDVDDDDDSDGGDGNEVDSGEAGRSFDPAPLPDLNTTVGPDGRGPRVLAQRARNAQPRPRRGAFRGDGDTVVEEWVMQDPHDDLAVRLRPLRKGKTYRAPSQAELVGLSTSSAAAAAVAAKSIDEQPITAIVRARAPFFQEFDYLYVAEMRNRRASARRKRSASRHADHIGMAEAEAVERGEADEDWRRDIFDGDFETIADVEAAMEGAPAADAAGDADDNAPGDDSDDDDGFSDMPTVEETAAAVEELPEDPVLTQQQEMCKAEARHLEEVQLAVRISEWHARLAPLLEEQEARPVFDIQDTGRAILDQLAEDKVEEDKVVKFEEIAKGHKPWQISRMFLSTLLLINCKNIQVDSTAPLSFVLKSAVPRFDISSYNAAPPPEPSIQKIPGPRGPEHTDDDGQQMEEQQEEVEEAEEVEDVPKKKKKKSNKRKRVKDIATDDYSE